LHDFRDVSWTDTVQHHHGMPRHAKFDDEATARPLYNRQISIHACNTCDTGRGNGGVAQLLELDRLSSNRDTWIIDCRYSGVLERDETMATHVLNLRHDEGPRGAVIESDFVLFWAEPANMDRFAGERLSLGMQ
jgi:hypothetical protein